MSAAGQGQTFSSVNVGSAAAACSGKSERGVGFADGLAGVSVSTTWIELGYLQHLVRATAVGEAPHY